MISNNNTYSYFFVFAEKYNTCFWNDSHFFTFKAKSLG